MCRKTSRNIHPIRENSELQADTRRRAIISIVLMLRHVNSMLMRFFATHLRNAETRPDEEKAALWPLLSENDEPVTIQNTQITFTPS